MTITTMNLVLAAAIAFSLSQVGLSIVLLARDQLMRSVQPILLLVFLLAVVSYLLLPLVNNPWLIYIVTVAQTLIPGLFWLLSNSLFDDQFTLNKRSITLVALSVLLPFLGSILNQYNLPAPYLIFKLFPQTLEFVFIVLAMVVMVRFWNDDLVEARRDLRLWFCGMTGLYMFSIVLMREVLFQGAAWLEAWQYVPLCVVCFVTNMLLLQYKPGLIQSVHNRRQEAHDKPSDIGRATQIVESAVNDNPDRAEEHVEVPEQLLNDLNSLMQDEHIYREMGLTIGQVAEKLDIQEYRLRKIINAGMGYRNFNDFLNGYRIKEAGERLTDPANPDEAVLNIALDIGFRSLSSFNKAFKKVFEKTPTEYRAAQLQKNN